MAQETAESTEATSRSEQSLTVAILDTVASLIIVLGRDGRIIYFNRACEETSGYTYAEVKGREIWDLLITTEERDGVQRIFAELQTEQLHNTHENHWITKDGRCRLIAWANTPVLDREGQVETIVATGTDITERQHTALLLDTGESLQRVTTAVLHKLTTLDDVLNIVCAEACQLTGASGSAVLLLEKENWMQVAASNGTPLPIMERLTLTDSLAGLVVDKQQPLLLNGFRDQVKIYYRNPDIKTLLAVPLMVDNNIIGVLDVVNKPGGFSQEDIQIMALFADQAAIAIENTQLHEQAEHLAILEERQRLARELHDSVTQTLYSVSLYTDATRMALAAGKQNVALEHLQELRKMAREAMLDMRLLIFELRPPILEREGLVAALQARLEAVEARSGLQTAFQVEGTCQLPLSVEEELYRLAQEALNNAVKHAAAQQVMVHVKFGENSYCLEVRDDGLGFDLETARHSGGLGLQGMEERIQRIGAVLSISCSPGNGTILQVRGTLH